MQIAPLKDLQLFWRPKNDYISLNDAARTKTKAKKTKTKKKNDHKIVLFCDDDKFAEILSSSVLEWTILGNFGNTKPRST